MDTSDSIPSTPQPMEVDSITDHGQDLSDIDILQHGHEFIPISSSEELIDDSHGEDFGSKAILTANANIGHCIDSSEDNAPHFIGGEPLATQILKTSTGQFVILQPNQSSMSIGGKIYTTSGQILSSLSSNTPVNSKPIFVNANQLGTGIRQVGQINQNQQPQFRMLQLKQPTSLSHSQNSGGVTKVILTSQPGGNLSQQLRLITSQANVNSHSGNIDHHLQTEQGSPSKIALQFQPLGLSLSSKNIIQSPTKPLMNDVKPGTKLKFPFTIPLKTSTTIPHFTTLQSDEPSQILPHNESIITSKAGTVNNPQKIIIKGNIPLGANSSNLKPGQILATAGSQLFKIPVSQLSHLSSQGQTVQLTSKMNFRLITTNSQTSTTHSNSIGNNQTIYKSINISKPIAPANNKTLKAKTIIPMSTNQTQPKRLLIPVSNQTTLSSTSQNHVGGIQIRPQGSITLPASALPPGVLSNAQPGSLVMIPAQYFQNTTGLGGQVLQVSNQTSSVTVPTSVQSKSTPARTVIDANGIKPRKPCNCTKSQCLKLYCDCFANGEFCNNCNCANCYNNLSHEEDRQKAIKCCLERNPQAFRPKIGKGGTDSERRHNKGCNCKRSGCLKNYCECYEAKIPCSNMCKCVGCRNVDNFHPYERKRLLQLAEMAEARVNQQISIKNRPITLASLPSPAKMSLPLSAKSSYCRISQEVVEATCHCLLAQAEKSEKSKTSSQAQTELKVINEFSRCLLHIIGFNSSKSKGSSD